MNPAQMFRADLNSTEQLVAFFAAVAVTTIALAAWSAITRTAQTLLNLARRQR